MTGDTGLNAWGLVKCDCAWDGRRIVEAIRAEMRDDPKDRSRVAQERRGHLALDPLDIGEPVAAVDLAIGQIDEGGAVVGEAFHRPCEPGVPPDGHLNAPRIRTIVPSSMSHVHISPETRLSDPGVDAVA